MVAPVGVQMLQENSNEGSGLALGAPCGPILKTQAVWKPFKRPLEEVLDAHCLKSRFLKDVLNEITTFGGSLEPQNHPETADNTCFEPQVFRL